MQNLLLANVRQEQFKDLLKDNVFNNRKLQTEDKHLEKRMFLLNKSFVYKLHLLTSRQN